MTLETPEFGTQMQLASPAKDCRLTRVHPKARMLSWNARASAHLGVTSARA